MTDDELRQRHPRLDKTMGASLLAQRKVVERPIQAFEPLPWQVEPWKDTSPVMLLTGSAGGGKALDVDTPILTLDGWKTMGTVCVGDIVFDERGQPCNVVAASDVMFGRPCYRLTFSSGEQLIADEQHQWWTVTSKERYAWAENLRRGATPERVYGQIRTTAQIVETLHERESRSNHAIRVAEPLQPPRNEPLLIPPYVLGVWLGDGHKQSGTLTCHDEDFEIIERVLSHGYALGKGWGQYSHGIVGLGFQLAEMGLLFNKHIPEEYFTASYEDRLELLRGLLDSDGSIGKNGRVEITQVRPDLMRDIQRLLSTLGIRASVIQNKAGYKGYKDNGAGYRVDAGTRYRISFYTDQPVFHLERKLERCSAQTTDRVNWRYITAVEPVESTPVRCIQVDSPSSLFLVGDTLIPTHNSRLAAEKLHGFCLRYPGAQALLIRKTAASLENSSLLLLERLVIGDDPNVVHRVGKSRFEYRNGSVLSYLGMVDAKQRELIRSIGVEGGVDICWMEEATQFDEQDYNEVLTRMRGRAAPWTQVILSTNPDAPGHWINMRLIIGGEASVYVSSATDNPHNPEEYRKNLQKLTGIQRQRLLLGLWVIGSGVIFDTWLDAFNPRTGNDQGGNVTPEADYIEGGGPVIWAIDDGYSGELDKNTGMYTGRSHPRVILMAQRRPTGQIAVFGEDYAIHTLAEQHLRQVQARCQDYGWPTRPSYVVRDRAAASIGGVIKEVLGRNARYNQVPVDESIKEAREWLAADENGFRRVLVHPRCKHLRFEMASYSYTDAGAVIKEHDNGPDALRYLVWNEAHGPSAEVDIASYDNTPLVYDYQHIDDAEVDIAF